MEMSKVIKATDLTNNIDLINEQLIKEMQLTPEEIEIYKKNNNIK